MKFDIRHSSLASWLNVIAALIAIAGVGSEFFPRFLPPLQQSVQIPLWALLATIALSPSIAIFLLRKMHKSIPLPAVEARAVEVPAAENLTYAAIESARGKIADLESQLAKYQSLENEILGVLGSGEEWNLNDLISRLNLRHSEDGARSVRLAVASLLEKGKIGSIGSGSFTKLKYLGS